MHGATAKYYGKGKTILIMTHDFNDFLAKIFKISRCFEIISNFLEKNRRNVSA